MNRSSPRASKIALAAIASIAPLLVAQSSSAQQEAPPSQPPWVMLPAVPGSGATPTTPAPTATETPPPPPPTKGTPALPPPSQAPPAYAPPGYAPSPRYQPYAPPPSYGYGGPVYEPVPYAPPPYRLHRAVHQGFYFRLGIGVTIHNSEVNVPVATATGNVITTPSYAHNLSGAGVAIDIAIGGAILPGLFLAADLGGHDAGVTTNDKNGSGWRTDEVSYSRFGGLIDWYPNPLGGFHIQGGAGFGLASFPNYYSYYPSNVGGFEANGGIGWEGWVNRFWSMGALVRLDYATMRGDVDGGQVTMKMVAPSILFTATFN